MNMAQQENQVVPFYFSKNRVRIHTDTDGNPWFVAKDVLLALGYQWKGIANLKHVPEEWRGVTSVQTPSGTQEMLMLSEQGLYFFLGRSDKPKALPFQKWLAGDVLPALRKTGRYETPHTTQENPTGPEEETFGDDRPFPLQCSNWSLHNVSDCWSRPRAWPRRKVGGSRKWKNILSVCAP